MDHCKTELGWVYITVTTKVMSYILCAVFLAPSVMCTKHIICSFWDDT